MTPEQLEAAITSQTRLLMLNSPSNPTGVCYSRADWERLGEVLRRHPRIAIASDDIYELIHWDDEPFCNIVMACPDLYERTILVNGVSKGYAMTGWRIGYTAAKPEITGAMKKIQGQMTSNASSISQAAAVAALDGDQTCVHDMVKVFKQRHDFVVERLNRGNGVHCLEAQGAFYAFPDVRGAIEALDGIDNDLDLATHLIEECGVALVPGSAFGSPGYLRLSFATAMEEPRAGDGPPRPGVVQRAGRRLSSSRVAQGAALQRTTIAPAVTSNSPAVRALLGAHASRSQLTVDFSRRYHSRLANPR